MRLAVAIRAFFTILFHKDSATKLAKLVGYLPSGELSQRLPLGVASDAPSPSSQEETEVRADVSHESARPSALDLLAALQRDARFIDFVKEDVSGYDDATLAAAARMVHDRSAECLERICMIRPLSDRGEGTIFRLDVSTQSPSRARFSGNISTGTSEIECRVVHSGWKATKCAPPLWSGQKEDALVLAPTEFEVE